MMATDELRYPIGPFERKEEITAEEREACIQDIEKLPETLRSLINYLTPEQIDTPYRPGGWTVRKLIHHVADSHMNAYTRFKLAVTEDNPTIKTYDQDLWSMLGDVEAPVEVSLDLIQALHARWTLFLRSLDEDQFARPFYHPEEGPMIVSDLLQLYSWHSRHHAAHVSRLIEREGWQRPDRDPAGSRAQ
ncbi:MAG: putative metal-dependent hydrolase [Rhodothermia bacterium]|nr:putative metal-dependent hydrolase [Rhodothermia bacterium]